MKHRNFREKNQPSVMIIPMIDIMLFLLVFFMISTIYMVQVNTLQVSLPQSSNAVQETRPNIILVTVTADGEIFFDKDSSPSQNFAEKIYNSLQADKEAVFVIRGDKSAKYGNIVSVLDTLKKFGARHVSIATEIKKTAEP
ncbi:MAG: biopolymer transporter ExbD [Selenomonadaceae bacterium]|nr:biopolymer transporter ExbD [Selenomonadaceae bacterium]